MSVGVDAAGPEIRIVVDAQPSGFWPRTWSSLSADAGCAEGPLRLRTARRILEQSGGRLVVATASGPDVVHIQLPALG